MRPSVELDWFRDLANLARTGSFSQAARLGHVSQPTLSRRIRALEHWVGVVLVDRSCQPVKLTPAGRQMLETGEQVLARLEAERSQIRESHSLPDRCVVTFAAQHSIAWRFYPAWLQALESTFGPILSRLRADDLPGCLRDLDEGRADFVLAYAAVGERPAGAGEGGRESLVVGSDRLVPVSKPRSDGGPLFRLGCAGPAIPFLGFGPDAPIGRHLEPLLRSAAGRLDLRIVYENAMAGALRIRARAGDGVAWLPESLVGPDLEAGLLVRAGGTEWEVPLAIRLHRRPEHGNRLTRAIWALLAARGGVLPLEPAARVAGARRDR